MNSARPSLSHALALAMLAAACREPPAREVRVVMGTAAEVRAVGLKPPIPAIEAAFAALTRVDRALGPGPKSELNRLNAAGAAVVSPELSAALAHALEVAEASGKAFDPAMGTGRVHLDPPRVRLEPGTRLDLGGIAKGYAVDLAMAELRGAGARKALVNLGGSSLSVFGEPLVVAVRDPESLEAPRWGSFTLNEASLGTSRGATVVARSGVEAAALSAAVSVLGAGEGLALLGRRGAAGFVLLREDGRKVLRTTPGFAGKHGLEASPGVSVRE